MLTYRITCRKRNISVRIAISNSLDLQTWKGTFTCRHGDKCKRCPKQISKHFLNANVIKALFATSRPMGEDSCYFQLCEVYCKVHKRKVKVPQHDQDAKTFNGVRVFVSRRKKVEQECRDQISVAAKYYEWNFLFQCQSPWLTRSVLNSSPPARIVALRPSLWWSRDGLG